MSLKACPHTDGHFDGASFLFGLGVSAAVVTLIFAITNDGVTKELFDSATTACADFGGVGAVQDPNISNDMQLSVECKDGTRIVRSAK